jgi:Mrp family chromosome partitioning ATPase/capsular polysaccharide biosynthesis protein
VDHAPDAALRLHIVRDAIRRRWLLVVVMALLFAGAGFALSSTRTTEYTAASRINLRAIPGNPLAAEFTASSQQIDIAMQTEAQLVTSPTVVDLVNQRLGTELEPGTRKVVATVPPNTVILRIEYTDSSRDGAQEGAEAFATQYLKYRNQQAESFQERQITTLTQHLRDSNKALQEAEDAADTANPPPGAAATVQRLSGEVATLKDSIATAESVDTQPGSVVTPATEPPAPSLVSQYALVGVAGVFGAVVGFVLIIWLERRDDRIRAAGSGYVAGVPVLADLTQTPAHGPRLLFQVDEDDPTRDAYRLARAGLLATVSPPATIAVSALSPKVSSTQVSVNLALSLAGAGYDVTVVDATLNGTTVASLLKIDESPGVADLLSKRDQVSIDLTEAHGLKVLPAGNDPMSKREFYAGSSINDLIRRLRRKSDLVIVAAPTHGSAESTGVTVHCDGVILVLTNLQDTHEDVLATLDRASRIKERIFGAIVIRPRKPGPKHEPTAETPSDEPKPAKTKGPEKRRWKLKRSADDGSSSKPRKGAEVSVRESDEAPHKHRPQSGPSISAQES